MNFSVPNGNERGARQPPGNGIRLCLSGEVFGKNMLGYFKWGPQERSDFDGRENLNVKAWFQSRIDRNLGVTGRNSIN